jgi:hypothetical protein
MDEFCRYAPREMEGEGGIGFADPLDGGLQQNNNSDALRASFFIPVRFCEQARIAPRNKKCPRQSRRHYCYFVGGEGGIRTPGGVTLNSFRDCHNQPLCHLSGRAHYPGVLAGKLPGCKNTVFWQKRPNISDWWKTNSFGS